MITGVIFLCMLQAAAAQFPVLQGPRPVPGRGDDPSPTTSPVQPLPPGPQHCKSESLSFLLIFNTKCSNK